MCCYGELEFDMADSGLLTTCPLCGNETTLVAKPKVSFTHYFKTVMLVGLVVVTLFFTIPVIVYGLFLFWSWPLFFGVIGFFICAVFLDWLVGDKKSAAEFRAFMLVAILAAVVILIIWIAWHFIHKYW